MDIIFFFFFLCLFSVEASACSIDQNSLDKSTEFPELAKTVVVGTIVEKDSGHFFVSKKPWENLNVRISMFGCGGFYMRSDAKEVLLTSEESIQDLMKGKNISIGNAQLSDISKASFFADKFGRVKEEFPAGKPNVFWRYCSMDNYCTKVKDACGNKVGVSLLFQSNYENYLKSQHGKVKCDKKVETGSKVSRCVKNFCN